MNQKQNVDTVVSFTNRNRYLPLLIAVFAVAAMIALCSCSMSRTALTTDQFISKMEAQGYTTVDVTNQFDSALVDNVTVAIKDNLQIEYYDLSSKEQALSAFQENQQTFENSSTGSNSHSSVSAGNYNTYTQSSSDEYSIVSQTDDTMVYCVCSADDKGTAESIIKDLGYL